MHPNAETIDRFYRAFARRDAAEMTDCYHADVEFTDEVFRNLRGNRACAMWEMLCDRAHDLAIEYGDIEAGDSRGSAHWQAWYTFGSTGRRVHNVIDAAFEFRDGRIIRHTDRFDFQRWASQALGPAGRLLGWSEFLKRRVRARAAASLDSFIERRS